MCYYLEMDSHIRDKVKVVLGLSNYGTEKKLNDVQGLIHLIQLLKVILLR